MIASLFNTDKIKIMGILNITPDSFSDGGDYFNDSAKAVDRAWQMVKAGAEIIDIGGESTRPGSKKVSTEEQIERILPVIVEVKKKVSTNILISVDTNRAVVAKAALKAGADLVNSMGGFSFDDQLAGVVSEYQCPIVIYHVRGKPSDMQVEQNLNYDVIKELNVFFETQLGLAKEVGVNLSKIILDPGIGFGKGVEQNLEIVRQLKVFKKFNLPLLVGISRKSHLGMILKEKLKLTEMPGVHERLEATLAETAVAIFNGASIVRTHDVLQTKKFITVLDLLREK